MTQQYNLAEIEAAARLEGVATENIILAMAADLRAAKEQLEDARKLIALVTVGQVVKTDAETIEAAGLNPWCVNEGLAEPEDTISTWRIDAMIERLTDNGV